MATALIDSVRELSLREAEASTPEQLVEVSFKVAGSQAFSVELELNTAVRELKKSDTLESFFDADGDRPIQILFTAGHEALVGGSKPPLQQRNPYAMPVRGLRGSKGERSSRMSGRLGGMGLIRKYGIMMKRQEFREKAEQIGFIKYR